MAQTNAARESIFQRFNPFATTQPFAATSNPVTTFFSDLGRGATTQTRGFFNSFPSTTGLFSTNTGIADSSKLGVAAQIASYVIGIVVVLLVLLVFVHFLISPIFQLHPGGKGFIPVPGGDDGVLFWKDTHPITIPNANLPISNQSYGYTINLDVFIENPLAMSTGYRLLFRRSDLETPASSVANGTIKAYIGNYNVAAVLLPTTNDLLVSVITSDNIEQHIQIDNVPVQEPFRLGIVVMEQALEVYINGKLMKTKPYSSAPKAILGDIYYKIGSDVPMAKLMNLKIWNRVLTTSEMRYAKPTLAAASVFAAEPIPSSGSC